MPKLYIGFFSIFPLVPPWKLWKKSCLSKTPLAVAKMIRPFHQISISDVRVSINNIFYKLYENLRTRNRTPTHLLPFSGLQFTPAGFSWLQHRPWRIQKLCPRNDSFHSEKSQISTITVLLQVIFDDEINTLIFLPLNQNLTNICYWLTHLCS